MLSYKKMRFSRFRLAFAVGILSMALVCYQLQLMYFLSIVQWHHFAAMVIAIALLGFGAAGTVISLFRGWMLKRSEVLLPLFMIVSGLLMGLVVRLSRMAWFRFDSYVLFVESTQYLQLLLTYLLFFLPFFLGALAIGMVFVKHVDRIGVYYFSDLAGAGIGGVLAIFLFWVLGPLQIPSVIALLPVFSGVLIIKNKARSFLFTLAVLTLSVSVFNFNRDFEFSHSEFKGLSYALNLPKAKIIDEKSSPYGWVQVVSSPVIRHAPGLSLVFDKEVSACYNLYNNGNWIGVIQPWSKKDSTHLLEYTTMALPYILGERKKALLLNPNVGLDIGHSLLNGTESITAVEPNKILVSLLKRNYTEFTDSLFYHPNLNLISMKPRTFLSRNKGQYDLIQLPILGAFGGNVGLDALRETNLLTQEAFVGMWHKLSANGVIAVTVWMDNPSRVPLKIGGAIAAVLESLKVSKPLNHVVAIKSWGTITFVIKRNPFAKKEVENVKLFCNDLNFDPLILPGLKKSDRDHFNTIEDPYFYELLDGMFTSEREKIIATYDFNIQPPTDDRPYFSQFIRWKGFKQVAQQIGQKSASFTGLGYLVTVVAFIQVFLLAILLIVLPLFRLGWKGGNKPWIVLYFSGLGFGFMFLEIVLIKYFTFYLGHPIYSAATVISIMLISSGLGSYFSSRFTPHSALLFKITGVIAAIIFVYIFVLGPVIKNTVDLYLYQKMFMSVVLIALPAFFMGMPFPLGLRAVSKQQKKHVPWAYGINGCVSVISSALAAIIAVEFGFFMLLFLAVLAYAIAFFSNFLLN